MKLTYLLFTSILFFSAMTAFSQDQTVLDLQNSAQVDKDTPKRDSGKIWTTGGTYTMTVGQGSQKNWAAGGDDFSFSLTGYLGLWALYQKDKISWDNMAYFNYGFLNTTSQGTRKNTDRIDATSKLGYGLSKHLNAAFLVNYQSQFTKGYQYFDDGHRELLSNFMSPGYLIVSLGLDYKPATGLSIFISPITSRWTFVSNDSLSNVGSYGVKPGKNVLSEIGAFASITYNKKLTNNITYSGKLDLFSNYKSKPQNVDVLMNNMFTAKVSKVISVNLGLDLIYDDDVRLFGPHHNAAALQLKQVLGAGVTLNL